MREFYYIATLLREKRIAKKMTQEELGKALGYTSGQVFSNTERFCCSLPEASMKKVSEILDISKEEMIEAIAKDYKTKLSISFDNESESTDKKNATLSLVA